MLNHHAKKPAILPALPGCRYEDLTAVAIHERVERERCRCGAMVDADDLSKLRHVAGTPRRRTCKVASPAQRALAAQALAAMPDAATEESAPLPKAAGRDFAAIAISGAMTAPRELTPDTRSMIAVLAAEDADLARESDRDLDSLAADLWDVSFYELPVGSRIELRTTPDLGFEAYRALLAEAAAPPLRPTR